MAKFSVYEDAVSHGIGHMVRNGGGLYTFAQIAAAMGMKDTRHFRRRIREQAARGAVRLFHAYNGKGGTLGICIHVMTTSEQIAYNIEMQQMGAGYELPF